MDILVFLIFKYEHFKTEYVGMYGIHVRSESQNDLDAMNFGTQQTVKIEHRWICGK